MAENFVTKTNSHNADGWLISTENIELFVTEEGAQIAPVTFTVGGKAIMPYHLTPWQDEDKTGLSGALKNLRGEIFCMPFGGNAELVNGEKHPAHGEVSGEKWELLSASVSGDVSTIAFGISVKVRKADVVKTVKINRKHPVLYFTHTISNSSGEMALGHHPIIKMPENGEKMYLSVGKFDFGMTCPGIFSDPRKEAYQILDRGKEFTTISAVPALPRDLDSIDYSEFPSPYGFTDLFSVFKKPSDKPAWVVAVYPEQGYLWFALKDAAVLPSTTLWISNSGRFFAPWNGRTYCIGVEDTCSFFAEGLKPSIDHNFLNDKGFPTTIRFQKEKPTEIRHIQGVAPVPADFGKVEEVEFGDGCVTFIDWKGKRVSVPVDYEFVMGR